LRRGAGVPKIAISTGSACSSAKAEVSHALRAVGLTEKEARATVRVEVVNRLRTLASMV
jgi:cysteine desulfurase